MTERISSLIDGELAAAAERDETLRSLGEGTPERERWDAYHLIGDALRATHGVGVDKEAFAKRLNDEPTILAPRRKAVPASSLMRWPVRIAASLAAVGFVGWIAMSFFDTPLQSNQVAASAVRATFVSSSGGGSAAPTFPAPSAGSLATTNEAIARASGAPQAASNLDDYLWAHQRFSPASLTHDVAPYVRLVSGRGAGQ